MQKTSLKQNYKSFVASSQEGLDKTYDRFQKLISQLEIHDILSMDDLYNNLKVCESEIKGQLISSSNSQNVTFVSLDNSSITNETVNTTHSVSAGSSKDQASTTSYADDVMFSFFTNQSNASQLDNEDLEQIDADDLEEIDLKYAKDKTGLGYDAQINESDLNDIHVNESEVLDNVFDSVFDIRESDRDDNQVNERFKRSKVSETITIVPKIETNASKTSNDSLERPKTVRSSAPLIEEWESDSEDENVFKPKEVKKTVKPSFEKIKFVNARNTIVENERKAKKPRKPVWNNTARVNLQSKLTHPHPKRNFVPAAVLTKSGQVPFNAAKQSSHRVVASVSATKRVNTAASKPNVNDALPTTYSYFKAHSLVRRPFNQKLAVKTNIFNENVNTTRVNNVTNTGPKAVVGNKDYAVKSSACWNWRPKGNLIYHISKDSGTNTLKDLTMLIHKADSIQQVLLKVPRNNNMYSFDLKNVVPLGGLTFLFAKATLDESNLWHRRLGHINFKTMNKLDSTAEAARTMLADSKFITTFWAEAVNTACYVQNRVLVIKPHSKTPYELFLGYSINSKAFRVFNTRTRFVEENMHIIFHENKPNVAGTGPNWMFDIDTLTMSMNYQPVFARNQTNGNVGPNKSEDEVADDAGKKSTKVLRKENRVQDPTKEGRERAQRNEFECMFGQDKDANGNSTYRMFTPVSATGSFYDTRIFNGAYDDDEVEGVVADFNNLELTIIVSPIPTTRIHKDHPNWQIIEDPISAPKTRRMTKTSQEHAMVYRNKKDERWIVVRNKARLVAQGHTQEEGINYDEVFAPVARIEAIRLFLAYASFMGFIVYQMDVKSAFLYGIIEVEVFRKRIVDKTLFIKKDKGDTLLVQVYVDDVIFGSTNKSLCTEFEGLMHKKFQMSSIRELTFFLGFQVVQRDDGIFISQDKYVADVLKKFDFSLVKTASASIETNKALLKDEEAEDVDVYLYISMIRSLMYLTASRPDIMFVVCACARFQVTPKVSHLHAMKRIFRYLKSQPKLGLWYSRDSPFGLEAFTDSNYAGTSLDRKSTTGGCQFLGKRLMSLQCKKPTVTTEADDGFGVKTGSCKVNAARQDLFWATAKSKTVNDVKQIHATVDGKIVVISESSVRSDLYFNDEDGITCLSNDAIFENLALMGNLDPSSKKFLMYPRFLQLFLNNQIDLADAFNNVYVTHVHTKKVFTNMKRQNKDFSRTVTPLFASMLVPQVVKGEGSRQPSEPQPSSSTALPSPEEQVTTVPTQPQKTHTPRRAKRGQDIKISQSSGPPKKVGDETVYTREDDRVVRAATTATSLEAEQESEVNTSRTGEDSMEHQDDLTDFVPPTPYDSPLSGCHTPGSNEECSRLGDQKATKESQKIRKKATARTLGMNLFKIGTSRCKSLDKENVSKQGRNLKIRLMFKESDFDNDFDDIDDMVDEAMENIEGDTVNASGVVNTATNGVSDASASVTTAGVSIITVEPRTPLTTTTTAFKD
uniref:Uncharacterized protein n=1 Tax=Tanacetum cinerariifolium TaxID=118510 RepID=A0A6L2L5G9_TANCI|nr:hypothetical protein [Tanacetum cinerariifolium]